ncbi:MAG: DUF3159 domain-containing protein [Bifidobacterium sp.]|nr:DUF3159 domain-containing protein [Bifidobacterium sp.]
MADTKKRQGFAALAAAGNGEDFSVIDAIGGVRGIVESMLPGFVFVVMFVITSDLKATIIVSAVLAVLLVVVRLIQRQTVLGALAGLISIAICLIWAWNTHEARNYYMYGFLTNSIYIVVLAITLAIRVPGVGFLVEFIRSLPTEHFRAWLADWRGDKKLMRVYDIVTGMWIGVFALRLVVQVPLYLTNHVTWLGTTRLLMGLPFWALAIWVSYLLIADPMRHHLKFKSEDSDGEDGDDNAVAVDASAKADDGKADINTSVHVQNEGIAGDAKAATVTDAVN